MQAPITLTSGSTTDPFLVNPDGWVLIEAGSSTVTLQYTTGTTTDIAAGTATWITAGSYTGFTAVRADEELADTWVKLTASGGSATYHVEGELSKADRLTVRGYKKSGINNFGATYSTDTSGNVTGLVGPGGGVIGFAQNAQVAAQLPLYRAKLAKIRAGLTTGTNGIDGQLKLGIIGDSTTMGAGAGTGGTTNTTNARPKCVARQLVGQFTQLGIAARADSFMGDQGYFNVGGSLTGYPSYDPRVAFTGTTGIYPNGAYRSLGGIYFQLKAASDTLTFTPENSWDTAVIYYENGATGVATMSLGNAGAITGGSTVTTTNSGNAFSFGKQTITIAKAATSLIFTQTSGTPVIRGVWCYDSTTPSVNIFNLGIYGEQLNVIQPFTTNAFASDLYDVVLINMSINDIGASVSDSSYITALSALVSSARSAGTDVIVATTQPTQTTAIRTAAVVNAYWLAITNFCASSGIPVVDLNTRMGTYVSNNTNGLMFDALHPNAAGYQDIATAYGNLLIRP